MAHNIPVRCLINRTWDHVTKDWRGETVSGTLIDIPTQSADDNSGKLKLIPVGIVILETDEVHSIPMEFISDIDWQGSGGTSVAGISVKGAFNSYEELVAAHPTAADGDAYLAGGRLYVWQAAANDWIDAGQMQGPAGPQGSPGRDGADGQDGQPGVPGVAATIEMGTTATGQPGTVANVTNIGTATAAKFNFTIPRGETGQAGPNTISSATAVSGVAEGFLLRNIDGKIAGLDPNSLGGGGSFDGVRTISTGYIYQSPHYYPPQAWFNDEGDGNWIMSMSYPGPPPTAKAVFLDQRWMYGDTTYSLDLTNYNDDLQLYRFTELRFDVVIPPQDGAEYNDVMMLQISPGYVDESASGFTWSEGYSGRMALQSQMYIFDDEMPVKMAGHFSVRIRPRLEMGLCDIETTAVYMPTDYYNHNPVLLQKSGVYFWDVMGNYTYPYPLFELSMMNRPFPDNTHIQVTATTGRE